MRVCVCMYVTPLRRNYWTDLDETVTRFFLFDESYTHKNHNLEPLVFYFCTVV